MGRYLSWAANSLLFVLCCYLVADTANEVVFAALLTPRAENSVGGGAPPAPVRREWSDRDVILKRNLFNASMLEPVAPIADLVMEESSRRRSCP